MSSMLINIAFAGCLVCAIGFLLHALWPWKQLRAFFLMVLGLIIAAIMVAMIWRWVKAGHPPLVSVYETLVLLAATIMLSVFVLEMVKPIRGVSAVGSFLGLIALAGASFWADATIKPLMPALKSNWLTVHVLVYFVSYGALAVGFGVSLLHLGRSLLTTGETDGADASGDLARLAYRIVAFAFPFLTLGLITGSIWAKQAWGSYWSWDPKETWSLITWLLYLIYLHLPVMVPGLRRRAANGPGRTSVVLSVAQVIAFVALVFTFLGMRYLPSAAKSLHVY